jgi:hypothetical protein
MAATSIFSKFMSSLNIRSGYSFDYGGVRVTIVLGIGSAGLLPT